ncbi:MAG: hypothetical protein AAF367_02870 [Pseudomonadota bacterium]
MLGLVLFGVLVGLAGAIASLALGGSLWAALLAYMVAGNAAIFAVSSLKLLLQHVICPRLKMRPGGKEIPFRLCAGSHQDDERRIR